MASAPVVVKSAASRGAFGKFGKWLFSKSRIFIFLFVVIPLILSIIAAIDQQSPVPFIEDVGSKVVAPTIQLNNQSLQIITGDIQDMKTGKPLRDFFKFAVFYGGFLVAFWRIWYLHYLFFRIMPSKSNSMENIQKVGNAILVIFIVTLIQISFISIFAGINTSLPPQEVGESDLDYRSRMATIPFIAYWNTAKAVIGISQETKDILEQNETNQSLNFSLSSEK